MCLKDKKVYLHKRRDSTNCDEKATTRKEAGALSDITNLATGLHQNNLSTYDSICRTVDSLLIEVIKCPKEAVNRGGNSH